MTADIYPIAAVGFNLLSLICFFNMELGNVGYPRWLRPFLPNPYDMTLYVLPVIGLASTIASYVFWKKGTCPYPVDMPRDFAKWTKAAIVSAACLVLVRVWFFKIMFIL